MQGMKAIYVRELTADEQAALEAELNSKTAFTVRRCQILLSSAKGLKAQEIAEQLHCSDQTVRKAIHAFEAEGLACLQAKSQRPHSAKFSFDAAALAQLPDIVATSPRAYELEHSLWSLTRLAQVCAQINLTDTVVSYETMRKALQRAGIKWKRARKRLQSNDAAYQIKKNTAMI